MKINIDACCVHRVCARLSMAVTVGARSHCHVERNSNEKTLFRECILVGERPTNTNESAAE